MKLGCCRASVVLLLSVLGAGCSKPVPSAGHAPPPQSGTAAPSGAAARSPEAAPPAGVKPETLSRAEQLSQRFIIVDGHVDLPFRLELSGMDGGEVPDVSEHTADGEFDYPRARAGGLDAPFMSIYVPATYQLKGGARAFADHLIDGVEQLVRQHPALFALARTPDDVRRNSAAGKLSLPLGIENGAALEGQLASVAHFRQRGVSYITLTHSKDNDLSDTSYESERTHKGLSALGKSVVREMNRVGIMIDVSHVSDDAFYQAVQLSQAPVIASHSSLRHFVPGFERNVSDDMLQALARSGGVIMINFGSAFLTAAANAVSEERKLLAAAFALEQKLDRNVPAERRRIETHVAAALPMPLARVEDVAEHIDRVKRLVGIDHVGLGSDFEGVGPTLPVGLEDASRYPNLLRVLIERGYTDAEIEKLCSSNLLRVWQRTLDVAREAESPRGR
jgi:membrane dipeptidase